MIKKLNLLLMLALSIALNACSIKGQNVNDSASPPKEGFYYGVEPPTMSAEPLLDEIFSQEGWELGGVHDAGMDEFYLVSTIETPFRPLVMSFRRENRIWKKYDFHFTGSDTMYTKDKYIERTASGWSKVRSLGTDFENIGIMRLTASSKGTLVMDERGTNGNGVLRYSRIINGKREAPKPFGKEINTGKWTAHPFIAPDESYLIWDSEREGGYGDSDMYISFLQEDGSWGPAINFGDKINTVHEDGGGYVTLDGKYLSFCPQCDPPDYDRKWVDAQIIEDLRPKTY